ncbi:alkaline phosphatase D family protein [Streptomyces marincola]|uniref:alkaline phosphatase D family protein n=1 Tax=Streptomyces marincola TaxID=2878388 RepID=UPI001CF59BE7|nr:alkaline phosphatase D family protein [Streptomyces marincola]UCM90045.1 alkaline phosphatase D family protein [Streptomyces marincola]
MDLTRRRLLGGAGAGTAALGLFAAGFSNGSAWASPRFPDDPFRLGVASGDPHPDGVVLWTRLAPDPLAVDGRGGMPERRVPVQWQVARDERFRHVVRRGTSHAVPELGHSVHVEVQGLAPGRVYYYRFRVAGEFSPTGRTRTAPSPRGDGRGAQVSFAFASCQCWYEGFYTAYRHMADEDLDFVVHLGDYQYEYGVGATAGVRGMELDASFLRETLTLPEYRNRLALTKLDADLQAAHQAFPWVLTWDDHEVENNWAGDIAAVDSDGFPDADPASFRARKAAAFQAYYEHLPLRLPQRPEGPRARMYRRLPFGRVLDLHVLDSRSYRDDQACGDGTKPGCDTERRDPARTMLGAEQERWLLDGAARSGATWNVLANQTLIAQVDQDPDPDILSSGLDMWDGYTAARDRLLTGLHRRGAANPVVLTGDIHRSVVADLKLDFDDERSPVVATEFAGTSISSGRDGAAMDQVGRNWLTEGVNPHLKWHNAQRGYTVLRATRRELRADYRIVPYVTTPGAPVETAARFIVEPGRPGAQFA